MTELTDARHKIESGKKIFSVIRTMKVMAATNVKEYEAAHLASLRYYVTIKRGLFACVKQIKAYTQKNQKKLPTHVLAVIFGSEQGLVGQFNDDILKFAMPVDNTKTIFAVGARIGNMLEERNISVEKVFSMPNRVPALTSLIYDLLESIENHVAQNKDIEVQLFHNHSTPQNLFNPVQTQLIPLNMDWQHELFHTTWPTNQIPEVIEHKDEIVPLLLREYLFVSLARVCSESLVAENKSRLFAMRRAEKKIGEHIAELEQKFNLLRQNSIDEELFDVVSGFISSQESTD